MRNAVKQTSIAMFLIIALVLGFNIWATADTVQGTVDNNLMNTGNISITIVNADGTTQSEAIAEAAYAEQWQVPCIMPLYDYQYQDEFRRITIKKTAENDMTYFVVDVQLSDPVYFQTALSGDKAYSALEVVSDIAVRNHAILAINGDDYGTHKYGTIIRNGELIRANTTTRNMLIVDQNGDMSVISDRKGEKPKALSQQLVSENVWQTFEFGPELVRDGQAVSFNSAFDVISTRSTRREPRTAIGQIDTLHYIIIIADGRQDGYSNGMTLPELQQLFVEYGAQTAMNLDGGGSTELWFQGQILNSPAGGEERYVSDIIFF
ncbi:MAG: phosphodiester glycosidase family protein [Eubacteriales bacterium]|nr:phosphodiester glycosidase family protein [Eubacteriales bacterium]HMM01136.1 phosphodiester glycosidase family protein [Bacilli bacterium]